MRESQGKGEGEGEGDDRERRLEDNVLQVPGGARASGGGEKASGIFLFTEQEAPAGAPSVFLLPILLGLLLLLLPSLYYHYPPPSSTWPLFLGLLILSLLLLVLLLFGHLLLRLLLLGLLQVNVECMNARENRVGIDQVRDVLQTKMQL